MALSERRGRSLVLDEVARAEADLAALASGRSGTLRVMAQCCTTYHWLPPVLAGFREECPLVDVEIAAEAATQPGAALRDHAADVALVATQAGFDELDFVELFEDEVVVIVPETHAWAEQAHVEPADFDGEHVFVWHDCTERDCVLTSSPRPVPRRAASRRCRARPRARSGWYVPGWA